MASVTRAENDPRYAAAEGWEPGVPRVQVNLYDDMVVNATGAPGSDGIIDDLNGDLAVTLADVDNHPFQWAPMYEFLDDGVTPNPDWIGVAGPEDSDLNTSGTFDAGDAIQVTTTDSWDDSKPSGCIQDLPVLPGLGEINECADGFGTWNQVRPGVFDGGYAFDSYFPGGIDSGSLETPSLPSGSYIVEAITPPGYELLKEEDRNVDFGDTYIPSQLLLPAECVGDLHTVPEFMSFDGVTPAPFAGETRPYCDRKQVALNTGQNAAADFFLFTQVPKAARAVGFVNNDLGAEFNQASPVYGEKLAVPWVPVSFTDWAGNELTRVYTDEFGGFNAMLPSTYTVNVPSPTGVSPNMITLTINSPFLADGVTPDPFYDPDFSVTPWTFHYMPGATSYLDTPIVPIAAFAANDVRIDTGPANGTPVIYSVTTESQPGPLVCEDPLAIIPDLPQDITIAAPPGGIVTIRNPLYPAQSTEPTIDRQVGFGVSQGSGTVTLDGIALPIVSWNDLEIVATVPALSNTGRILVNRDNGLIAERGVTLNIQDCTGLAVYTVAAGGSIQAAVDVAAAGDIILVGPGQFNENVIMDIPVRLQGVGAGSFINANPIPIDRLADWHTRLDAMGGVQEFINFLGQNPFSAAEAPGILVVGETNFDTQALNLGNPFSVPGQAAIDGFTISGSKAGGGIFAVSGATGLVISNNDITGNQGNYAGGIALGTPATSFDAGNDGIVIRHNKIHRNGGVQGGGGISLNEGAEGYLIDENIIIGNFGRFSGGGIAHRGLSLGNNVIQKNRILFNEVFFGGLLAIAGDGAGIYIGGEVAGGMGSGSVTINGNLIQGNMSGAGKGGGIRAFAVNADDVRTWPAVEANWYRLNIFNNIIVNNIAGHSGGGISLQDVAMANIVNNTVANNDSTATSALAFEAGQADSTPQPAGIVSAVHSSILQDLLSGEVYSNPLLVNNIIWHNRSFFNDASVVNVGGGLSANPAGLYWDTHVLGSVSSTDPHLIPEFSILSSLINPATGFTYAVSNSNVAPGFYVDYFNFIEATTVVDEGGNAINLRFTPIRTLGSDYHIGTGQAWNNGSDLPLLDFAELGTDFDGEPRPFDTNPSDIGADEIQAAQPAVLNFDVIRLMVPGQGTGSTVTISQMGGGLVPETLLREGEGVTGVGSQGLLSGIKEKLAGVLAAIIPGSSESTRIGNEGEGSGISLPVTRNTPGFSNAEDNKAENGRSFARETLVVDSMGNVLNNASSFLQEENANTQAFTNTAQGESSLSSSYGTERILPAVSVNPSGVALAGTRHQGEQNDTLFRYALLGLLLAGLAFGFFSIFMPWMRER